MSGFVERFGLWSEDQRRHAVDVIRRLEAGDIDVVRFAFPDQHGILRGKTLVVSEVGAAFRDGVSITSTLLAKDTSHKTVFPIFATGGGLPLAGFEGGADLTLVADPTTFKVLPWSPRTGWLLCDAYMADGRPCPFATRGFLQRAVEQVNTLELDFIAGLEVEFHVFKLDDPRLGLEHSGQPGEPPRVSLLSHGYQYLTEMRYDAVEPVMDLLRVNLLGLGLPLRSLEVEYGPSQFELTFGPSAGVLAADNMVLLRSAIKQVCRRAGYHATFMCRPRIPNVMSSGWHLHQSLRRHGDGGNAFMPAVDGEALSAIGMHYLGGLKAHACGAAALASPTINGYRRYRPFSLAPDRATWGRDNRAAMLRVLGGRDQAATRIENRVGEPTANPYLYLASQLFSGLDGMRNETDPGPSADAPYETPAEALPRSLGDALVNLRADAMLVEQFGAPFIDYLCHIKQAEIARFDLEVSEWEQREYFDLF